MMAMRSCVLLVFGVLLCAKSKAGNDTPRLDADRPNVILIVTDDQGYGDLSVHGNPVLKTPILDRLHAECVRFTNFHVTPMCTPTRGELMTGHDAKYNGATMVNQGRSMMHTDLPTMAEIFKESGYHTAHFGKWHLGDSYPHRPQDRGFEETVHHGAWGLGSIADYYTNGYWDDSYLDQSGNRKEYKGYCTDVWFDLTIKYVERQQAESRPFFLYLATNAPHSPHLVDEHYAAPYKQAGVEPRTANFFGQISNIDDNMGRLLSILQSTGLDKNTVLIYLTDNGTSRGHNVFNAGMRGHKTEVYEGGHRVPLFVRWPNGAIGLPRDIDKLARSTDVLPTLIDLCELKRFESEAFDGVSLMPLLNGDSTYLDNRLSVIEYDNPYRPDENKVVLWKDWRLVKNKELYNLKDDPGQQFDVAEKRPDIVAKLLGAYRAWLQKVALNYARERYIHVGSKHQNPLMLFSSDWKGTYADGLWNLIDGDDTGKWELMVERAGRYEITFYRWHPDSGLAMNAPYHVEGTQKGGALPVHRARLKIGDLDETKVVSSGAKKVEFSVDLAKGAVSLENWLLDEHDEVICSAYYVKVNYSQ